MKYIVGLDLSYSNVGISIFNNGKYDNSYVVLPDKKDSLDEHTLFFVYKIFNLLNSIGLSEYILVVEDLFLGKDFGMCKKVLKMHGVINDIYYRKMRKLPIYMPAVTARKAVGIDTRSNKAEIQLYIYNKYKDVLGECIKKDIQYNEKYINNFINKYILSIKNRKKRQHYNKDFERFLFTCNVDDFILCITYLKKMYKIKKINKKEFDYCVNCISKRLDVLGYSQHICDAIVLCEAIVSKEGYY
jgi:Holliday junction resolvasome RuvABC endonuclease subunit